MDNRLKEEIIVLIKSILENDRGTINRVYGDLKKSEGVHISILEDYGSSFKLHIQESGSGIDFNFEYGDDYVPF